MSKPQLVYLLLSMITLSIEYYYYTSFSSNSKEKEFSVSNVREVIRQLSNLGPRVTGTKINDMQAVDEIKLTIEKLIKSSAVSAFHHPIVEIDYQYPSSDFFIDFLGGITNVKNFIVSI